MDFLETLVTISTPPAHGAIGIIRLSGPAALPVLQKVFMPVQKDKNGQPFWQKRPTPFRVRPRHLSYGKIINSAGETLDYGMACFLPGPHSFTGEDIVELHCHGGLVLLKKILQSILQLADVFEIRAAEPGEFTKRAYLNGKLDLTQAEAIHEMITAESEASLKASLANLDGMLAQKINALKEQLLVSLALVEAGFEFPEEDIQTYDRGAVLALLVEAKKILEDLQAAYQTSKLYDEGVAVALVGAPNVGKSSLLNAILVENRAIVTDIAGTTRDVVEGQRVIEGIRYVFRDTAGLRDTTDVVESVGIDRAKGLISKSDLVLWVFDDVSASPVLPEWGSTTARVLKVLNKADLFFDVRGGFLPKTASVDAFDCVISVKENFGIHELLTQICGYFQGEQNVHQSVHVNQRQYQAILQVYDIICHIEELSQSDAVADELLAEEIRAMIAKLDEITGTITSEDVLGEIFKRFCIGK